MKKGLCLFLAVQEKKGLAVSKKNFGLVDPVADVGCRFQGFLEKGQRFLRLSHLQVGESQVFQVVGYGPSGLDIPVDGKGLVQGIQGLREFSHVPVNKAHVIEGRCRLIPAGLESTGGLKGVFELAKRALMVPQRPPGEPGSVQRHDFFKGPRILFSQIKDLSLQLKGFLVTALIPGVVGLFHQDICSYQGRVRIFQ